MNLQPFYDLPRLVQVFAILLMNVVFFGFGLPVFLNGSLTTFFFGIGLACGVFWFSWELSLGIRKEYDG